MTLPGPRTRALALTSIALAVAASVGCAGLFFMNHDSAVAKIGPGYARMKPIDEGKPYKVVYSVPYVMPARPNKPKTERPVREIAKPVIAQAAEAAPPTVVADVVRSYAPDKHHVY